MRQVSLLPFPLRQGPKVTATQRHGSPGLVASKGSVFPSSYTLWTGHALPGPFSLAVLGITTVSLLVGVGDSELCLLC